jgi:hypothetical protein
VHEVGALYGLDVVEEEVDNYVTELLVADDDGYEEIILAG